ncbi:MAG: hypothetical protein H0Z39_11040 [Peptococcaceae bacterium]|nr:hypothetical protein [Peptococcaceae bacterium]
MTEEPTARIKNKEFIIIAIIAVGVPLSMLLSETGWLHAYQRPSVKCLDICQAY